MKMSAQEIKQEVLGIMEDLEEYGIKFDIDHITDYLGEGGMKRGNDIYYAIYAAYTRRNTFMDIRSRIKKAIEEQAKGYDNVPIATRICIYLDRGTWKRKRGER